MDRRRFLGVAAAGAGAIALGGAGVGSEMARASRNPAKTRYFAGPGLRPYPWSPEGTDHLPEVDHIVCVMMENHSFDNILGVLGRGDGFTIKDGKPTNSNPNGKGGIQGAFHMPTPCQTTTPSQSWNASHQQYDNGTNQGFVVSPTGPVAMGYWTEKDLPFTYSLASTFPIADQWHCSVLGQTDPNRRYLLAGTSLGLINDGLPTALPPHGTIMDQLHRHGITWRNYWSNLPSVLVWFGLEKKSWVGENLVNIDEFYKDCANGTLPSFSMVDPNFSTSSEENPQDIQFGEVFLSKVVNAVMHGPKWEKTLLIWNYDEHGGYYDHVVPPLAPIPDNVPPMLATGDVPGKFNRFGFRVPAGLVSPYAKPNHVSHVLYDHTSVLKLIHNKFNLPSLTHRDAAANDIRDMVDFSKPPAFLKPPKLHAPVNPALRDSCEKTGPGPIP
ncbi:MAG: alkaline phosphatase family protein [Acidimicrobiales bacterium]